MSGNLPIIYRNVMDGLPSDFARDVFLWAVDQFPNDPHAYKAERFAHEADRLFAAWATLIDMAQWTAFKRGDRLLSEDQKTDLMGFVMTRHANWRCGGNRKPTYAEAAE